MVDTDDTLRTMDDGRRPTNAGHLTMPRVWHKLPTGELIIKIINLFIVKNTNSQNIAGLIYIKTGGPLTYLFLLFGNVKP